MGQLLRLLVVLAGIGLMLFLLRRGISGQANPKRGTSSSDNDNQPMVPCAHCGIHIPSSVAVFSGPVPYCSEDHKIRGPQR
jgi:uncharacterized protein